MEVVHPIAFAALIIWCAVLSGIDIRTRRLPDVLTLMGAAAVLAVAVASGRGAPACAGALLLAVPYLLVHLISPAACGAGDIKLALGTGAAAACGSAHSWVWAAIGAPLLTAMAGAGIHVATRYRRWTGIDVADGGRSGPDIREQARVREPPRRPGPDVVVEYTAAPRSSVPAVRRAGCARIRPTTVVLRWRDRFGRRDSRCARSVLTTPITVPHGPAMCLATVAALWPTV